MGSPWSLGEPLLVWQNKGWGTKFTLQAQFVFHSLFRGFYTLRADEQLSENMVYFLGLPSGWARADPQDAVKMTVLSRTVQN